MKLRRQIRYELPTISASSAILLIRYSRRMFQQHMWKCYWRRDNRKCDSWMFTTIEYRNIRMVMIRWNELMNSSRELFIVSRTFRTAEKLWIMIRQFFFKFSPIFQNIRCIYETGDRGDDDKRRHEHDDPPRKLVSWEKPVPTIECPLLIGRIRCNIVYVLKQHHRLQREYYAGG